MVEQPGRRLGQQDHDFLQVGPLHLTGLAGAAIGMRRDVPAGRNLEISLVLTSGVSLSIVAAKLRALTERLLGVGHRKPPALSYF